MLKSTPVMVFALALAACSDAFGPRSSSELARQLDEARDGIALVTDSVAYAATRVEDGSSLPRYAFRVIARYTNRTNGPVYLARCYPDSPTPIYDVVEARQPEQSAVAYSPFWGCVGHDRQIGVAPGASRVDTLVITGPNASKSGMSQGIGATEGAFRLVYGAQACRGDGACPIASAVLRYSNEFRVTVSR